VFVRCEWNCAGLLAESVIVCLRWGVLRYRSRRRAVRLFNEID